MSIRATTEPPTVSPIISTFAGTGTAGYTGDGGAATLAKVGQPIGIAVDSSNNVYIADFNGTVRKVDPLGTITGLLDRNDRVMDALEATRDRHKGQSDAGPASWVPEQ